MNAVIFAEKRTGSTFLQEALRSHPDITSLDELFMGKPGYGGTNSKHGTKLFKTYVEEKLSNNYSNWQIAECSRKYLDEIFEEGKNVVFRFMYPQYNDLIKWYKLDLFGYFEARRLPIIHFRRKNWLKTVLSMEMKKINKQAVNGNIIKKISINPLELHKKIRKCMKNYMKFGRKAYNVKVTELIFEDILGKTEGNKENIIFHGDFNIKSDQITYLNEEINEKLCDFFKVEHFPMHTNISQISDPDMWKYIENKNDVIKYLTNNGYGKMCYS